MSSANSSSAASLGMIHAVIAFGYQMLDRGISPITINAAITGLKFFFGRHARAS